MAIVITAKPFNHHHQQVLHLHHHHDHLATVTEVARTQAM